MVINSTQITQRIIFLSHADDSIFNADLDFGANGLIITRMIYNLTQI